MQRVGIWAGLLLSSLLVVVLATQMQAEVSTTIEVRIPEQSATVYLERSDQPTALRMGPMLATRTAPSSPPHCNDNPSDPTLCLRPQDVAIFFDLRCATLSELPAHCEALYPEIDGRFLDDDGRPYPPMKVKDGRIVPGSKRFPQFFTYPSMRLHVYTNAVHWSVSVRLEAPLADANTGRTLGAEHFAVHSIITGDGNAYPPTPEWKCLGYAADWPESVVCPAPVGPGGGVVLEEVDGFAGGWLSITLGVKLRLDGTEVPGVYEGTLTYYYTEL